jgi:hypothetical protein
LLLDRHPDQSPVRQRSQPVTGHESAWPLQAGDPVVRPFDQPVKPAWAGRTRTALIWRPGSSGVTFTRHSRQAACLPCCAGNDVS